jgi:hypothetical protein
VLEFDELQKFISEDASYDSRARFPPPRCHPGTRVRVLKTITDWINDPDPPQRIFWLSGPAGAGKSAIAQTIAEHCEGTRLAASFFFQRNTSDRGVLDRLFLTLAWQLATSIPKLRPYLESTLKAERSIHAKSINVQFDRLFMKAFELLLRNEPGLRPEKGLVIVDALDECNSDQDQKDFLTLIENELASRRIPLRFLISSRPEPHIQETFNMDTMKRITSALVLDETFGPNDDIRKYLEDEFSRIFTGRRISLSPPDAVIINHLVSEASGQFIYASTVIKFVDKKDRNPRKQLEIILKRRRANPTSPYTPLDQLYTEILSQQPNVRVLRDVFVLVIALGRVDIGFVCRRLRMSKDDLEPDLHRMHSILNISDVAIEAYHLSLRDFLQDKKRAGKYYIHPMRVTLVRLPQNIHRFMTRNRDLLDPVALAIFIIGIFPATGIMGFKAMIAGFIVIIAVPTLMIIVKLCF